MPSQKLAWLQRHDRESGNLYGVVPLIRDMPVALTDHIDRSPDKQLLRGKVGYVHSWVLDEHEKSVFEKGVRVLRKLPLIVFVQFYNADGTLPEWTVVPEQRGLYPIVPKKATWFLDKGRKYPVLGIRRQQLPLAPAFAITAHCSQGQTLTQGAIVDLRIGRGTSPIASYVAMTRVEKRQDMLIYREFERELFTSGPRRGPELLLRKLRGEQIDWKAIEDEFTPSRRCTGCRDVKYKQQFALQQWNRRCHYCIDTKSLCPHNKYCKICVEAKKEAGTPLDCSKCGCWKPLTAFDADQIHHRQIDTRLCSDCVELRRCRGECGQAKSEHAFSAAEWREAKRVGSQRGVCKTCNATGLRCTACGVRQHPN